MCNEQTPPDDLDVVSEMSSSQDALRVILEAVASPATTPELGDVEAAVAAFRSGLVGPASGTVQGSRVVRLRQVPRRVVAVVVGTLLVTGTAAAAATDVLPSWVPIFGHEAPGDAVVVDDKSTGGKGSGEASPGSDDSASDPVVDDTVSSENTVDISHGDGAGSPPVVSVPEQSSRDWGWCTAWSKGGGDDPAAGGGATVKERLEVLAAVEGLSVVEFCGDVLAHPPSEKDPGHGQPDTVPETSVPDVPNPDDPNPDDPNPEDPNPDDPNPDDTVSPSDTVLHGAGNGGKGHGHDGQSTDTTAP